MEQRIRRGVRTGLVIGLMGMFLISMVGTPLPVGAVIASCVGLACFVLEYLNLVECFPDTQVQVSA